MKNKSDRIHAKKVKRERKKQERKRNEMAKDSFKNVYENTVKMVQNLNANPSIAMDTYKSKILSQNRDFEFYKYQLSTLLDMYCGYGLSLDLYDGMMYEILTQLLLDFKDGKNVWSIENKAEEKGIESEMCDLLYSSSEADIVDGFSSLVDKTADFNALLKIVKFASNARKLGTRGNGLAIQNKALGKLAELKLTA